jgi:hypothetical protein
VIERNHSGDWESNGEGSHGEAESGWDEGETGWTRTGRFPKDQGVRGFAGFLRARLDLGTKERL